MDNKIKHYLKSFLTTYPIYFKEELTNKQKKEYIDFAVEELFKYIKKLPK